MDFFSFHPLLIMVSPLPGKCIFPSFSIKKIIYLTVRKRGRDKFLSIGLLPEGPQQPGWEPHQDCPFGWQEPSCHCLLGSALSGSWSWEVEMVLNSTLIGDVNVLATRPYYYFFIRLFFFFWQECSGVRLIVLGLHQVIYIINCERKWKVT